MVCEPVSFIAPNLRKRETDLILRLPYLQAPDEGIEELWIYILLEHQSEPDAEIPLRLLHGMDGLWTRQRQEFESLKRGRTEAGELVESMAEVRPASVRQETIEMAKTYAQELIDEGEARGQARGEARGEARGRMGAKREALLMLLNEKFGPLGKHVVSRVKSLDDTEALDVLMKRLVHAQSLADMGELQSPHSA